jgi:hypothetical protein
LRKSFQAVLLLSVIGCSRAGCGGTTMEMSVDDMCRLADGARGAAIVDLLAVRDLARSTTEPRSIGRKLWWRPSLLPDNRMRVVQWPDGVGLSFPVSDGYDTVWFGVGSLGAERLARLVPSLDRTVDSVVLRRRILKVSFSPVATTSTFCHSEGRVALLGSPDIRGVFSRCLSVPFELRPEEFLSFGSSPEGVPIPADRAAVDAADGAATFGPGTPLFWQHEPTYGPAVPVACGRL